MAFQWTRSTSLALARQRCELCHGLGRVGDSFSTPCRCVLRSIFRLCHERFIDCVKGEKFTSVVKLDLHNGPERRGTWSFKHEEYMADFILLAHRTLSAEDYRLFRYRFLLGADWRLCAEKMRMDRGTCFNRIYSMMQRLGRAFAETEPYPMFPLSEYFYASHRGEAVKPCEPPASGPKPVRPPVKDTPGSLAKAA